MGAIDGEQRQKVIEQFQQDQRRVLAMLSAERDRQLRALEDHLRQRRIRRQVRAEKKLREQMEREKESMRKRIAHVAETARQQMLQSEKAAAASGVFFAAAHKGGLLSGTG